MRYVLFPLLLLSVTGQRLTREENDHLQMICGRTFLVNETGIEKSMNTNTSTRNEAPFTIQFRRTPKDGSSEDRLQNSNGTCSGTIISRRHILTAAHCFDSYMSKCWNPYDDLDPVNISMTRIAIAAPTNCNPSNTTECDSHFKSKIINVKRAYVPYGYNCIGGTNRHLNTTITGDVAIAELEEDIEFSPTVQPACVRMKTGPRLLLTVYGYGWNGTLFTGSNILRKHESKTISPEKCQKLVDKHRIQRDVKTDEVCSTSNISMTCAGDSGGGLIFRASRNKRVYVVAATSWGPRCMAGKKYPAAYLDVSAKIASHMDWIWAVTGIQNRRRNYAEEDREEFMKKVRTLELDPDVNQPKWSS